MVSSYIRVAYVYIYTCICLSVYGINICMMPSFAIAESLLKISEPFLGPLDLGVCVFRFTGLFRAAYCESRESHRVALS